MDKANKKFDKEIYLKILFFMALAFAIHYNTSVEGVEIVPDSLMEGSKEIDLDPTFCYLKPLSIKPLNPANTIFAFDLHEVLFRRNFRKIAYGGIKLFCKSFFYTLVNPTLIPRMIDVSYEDIAAEGMYVKLAEEYPYLQNFQGDMCEMANGCCRPIERMISLVRSLKKQGFKTFLLSNLGENALEDFKRRFNYIEELFDGFYSPCKKNNYICKPLPQFYGCFKEYLSSFGHQNKQILFIDDLEKNIAAACRSGIAGIHFVGYDNLCATLHKIGIDVNNTKL